MPRVAPPSPFPLSIVALLVQGPAPGNCRVTLRESRAEAPNARQAGDVSWLLAGCPLQRAALSHGTAETSSAWFAAACPRGKRHLERIVLCSATPDKKVPRPILRTMSGCLTWPWSFRIPPATIPVLRLALTPIPPSSVSPCHSPSVSPLCSAAEEALVFIGHDWTSKAEGGCIALFRVLPFSPRLPPSSVHASSFPLLPGLLASFCRLRCSVSAATA